MCPKGYEEDALSLECVPDITVPEESSTESWIATIGTPDLIKDAKVDYSWIVYIAVASAALVAGLMVIVLILVLIQRRRTGDRRVNDYVETPEEFDKLNGIASRNRSYCLQENNSNSQAVNGSSKDLEGKKAGLRNTGSSQFDNGCTKNYLPEKNPGTYQSVDHSFPLPATELGATVLVTTKTTQRHGENSKY